MCAALNLDFLLILENGSSVRGEDLRSPRMVFGEGRLKRDFLNGHLGNGEMVKGDDAIPANYMYAALRGTLRHDNFKEEVNEEDDVDDVEVEDEYEAAWSQGNNEGYSHMIGQKENQTENCFKKRGRGRPPKRKASPLSVSQETNTSPIKNPGTKIALSANIIGLDAESVPLESEYNNPGARKGTGEKEEIQSSPVRLRRKLKVVLTKLDPTMTAKEESMEEHEAEVNDDAPDNSESSDQEDNCEKVSISLILACICRYNRYIECKSIY